VRVELDYSRQSVFELGVLAFEIVNGSHPVEGYPGSVTSRSTGRIEYGDDDIARISEDRLGSEQASMLRRSVSCDASRRPSLDELIRCFDPEGDLGVDNFRPDLGDPLRISLIEQRVRGTLRPILM